MIHQSFHCPSCGELGFLDTDPDELRRGLVDAVCHYCGHVVTEDEVAEERERAASPREIRASRRGREPRR